MIELISEKGKNVGIFGLARTGLAAYDALHGIANIVCFDDNESNRATFVEKFGDQDLKPIDGEDWTKLDYIILSPGVPLYFPEPHQVVHIANRHSIQMISDIELLYRTLPEATYVAVTGTNGKSTTTALIGHILGADFAVGGNIGTSAISLDAKPGYVLELSSYQLDLAHDMRPRVAVLLNITPDHIERHGSMSGYIAAKKRIWQNMGAGDSLVIGVDNDVTRKIYEELKNSGPFELVPISAHDEIEGLPYNNSLLGWHNRENAVASYAVARILGRSHEEIIAKIATFGGLKHRMQFLGAKGNVSFYNDSKATNADAAEKSLSCLRNIYWLAGGIPKEGGIESLELQFDRIKKAYLFGQAKEQFAKTLDGVVDYAICENMQEAFDLAVHDATASDMPANVLLAPACASWDQFSSFEQRGDEFEKLFQSL